MLVVRWNEVGLKGWGTVLGKIRHETVEFNNILVEVQEMNFLPKQKPVRCRDSEVQDPQSDDLVVIGVRLKSCKHSSASCCTLPSRRQDSQ